jgi:hypothetical protein
MAVSTVHNSFLILLPLTFIWCRNLCPLKHFPQCEPKQSTPNKISSSRCKDSYCAVGFVPLYFDMWVWVPTFWRAILPSPLGSPWKYRHYVFLKRWNIPVRLHFVRTQQTMWIHHHHENLISCSCKGCSQNTQDVTNKETAQLIMLKPHLQFFPLIAPSEQQFCAKFQLLAHNVSIKNLNLWHEVSTMIHDFKS